MLRVMDDDSDFKRALAKKEQAQQAFYQLCARADAGDPAAIEALKNRPDSFGEALAKAARKHGKMHFD